MLFFNVRDFGARGDGVAYDTPAIMAAIGAAAANGGGTVFFPAGTYVSGTLELCSNLTLHLDAGATLRGASELDAYTLEPEKSAVRRRYFLYGNELSNVSISGRGVIDGNGSGFWKKELAYDVEVKTILDYNIYKPMPDLPIPVYLTGCGGVAIDGITIVNSANYTVWLIGCERVHIHGVTIRTNRLGPNTDGIDVDCCRLVRISDCDIETGDDCITLKSDPYRTGKIQPCEHIAVNNCLLSSPCCAIRIGYEGDAPIRHCCFSNLVIRDTRHAIDILSIAPVCAYVRTTGTEIENISFDNIVLHNAGQPVFIWAGSEAPRTDFNGHIRDLRFSRIAGDAVGGCYIGSKDGCAIENLVFRDIDLEIDNSQCPPDPDSAAIPSHWGGAARSGGMRFHNLRRIRLENVTIRMKLDGENLFVWDKMNDFVLNGRDCSGDGAVK